MVVEMLTFTVTPADQPTWLRVEGETWTRFLETCPGFVGKQVWADRERPDQMHCVIVWTDQASWDAVDEADCARVDASMGEWYRPCTMRSFDLVRDY